VGFRRLSKNAQQALIAAAVLDNPVSAAGLAEGTRLKGRALEETLDELEWRRWLTSDARGYTFVARIVRDVVERDMVTEGQKRRIRDAKSHS
jgi:hypothetical protein